MCSQIIFKNAKYIVDLIYFSHTLPDNYGRNKIITQQKTWQYVCKVDLGKSIRQKNKNKNNKSQTGLFI